MSESVEVQWKGCCTTRLHATSALPWLFLLFFQSPSRPSLHPLFTFYPSINLPPSTELSRKQNQHIELIQDSTMTVYSTSKGSHYLMSQTLSRSIQYLGENATMNLFSVKNVNLGSSQTVFNPDGRPIADTVHLSMRSSSIGSNSVDCK